MFVNDIYIMPAHDKTHYTQGADLDLEDSAGKIALDMARRSGYSHIEVCISNRNIYCILHYIQTYIT